MLIADMHSDTLSLVTERDGIINDYNFSAKYPQLQFFAAFVPYRNESAEARRKRALRFMDVYLSEVSRTGLIPIRDCRDLNMAIERGKSSAIFAVEGGGGLFADSEELDTLYRLGMRVLGLAWDTNELAGSAWDGDLGLTDEGKRLVERASEMGIILDVSHLSDRSTEELLELTPYPVLATHSNFREVADSPRNLPTRLARQIAKSGGVIGLNLYPPFLSGKDTADGEDILRQVGFGLDLLGEDALGFGFDIDGTDGVYPRGFGEEGGSIHDRVVDLLLSHYSASTVEKIAGANVLEFCKNNL